MADTKECIEVCNSLLRGELSAVETYTQAVEKFEDESIRSELEEIRTEHEQSAFILSQHLIEMGEEPAISSGVWGSFAQAVEGTAKMMGESAALIALEQGEEHGINEYQDALHNPGVMEQMKTDILQTLLPRLSTHQITLKRLRND